jgi:hypothetical protein
VKIVILITVIETSAVMLAILYYYYRRSQSGKRANSEGNQKSRPGKALDFNAQPVKADIKI